MKRASLEILEIAPVIVQSSTDCQELWNFFLNSRCPTGTNLEQIESLLTDMFLLHLKNQVVVARIQMELFTEKPSERMLSLWKKARSEIRKNLGEIEGLRSKILLILLLMLSV
jgi:hypothetical protein